MNSKEIKILAIGNSFSVDSMEYLYPLLQEGGYSNIILGNLYIGGCCLETHVNNTYNNNKDYIYYINKAGTWEEHPSFDIYESLISEEWDIISMQQCSGRSGLVESYQPFLDQLISFVRKYNKKAKLYWNMTWAYHTYSDHDEFVNYQSSQIKMYEAIINCVNKLILEKEEFYNIIPVGTTIQNLRTIINDDLLTRDGYHLSLEVGRFAASLTWFKSLTGIDFTNISYKPSNIDINLFNYIKKAATAALNRPFSITNLK